MSEPLTVDVGLAIAGPIRIAVAKDEIAALVRHALSQEGVEGSWELGIQLVGDDEIRALHREFMGLDTPTDIMTFPFYAPHDDGEPWALNDVPLTGGDIVISMETAAMSAREAGWPLQDELRFLVLHGILHLLGWDDRDSPARDRMLGRQRALLESFTG